MTHEQYDALSSAWQRDAAERAQDAAMDEELRAAFDEEERNFSPFDENGNCEHDWLDIDEEEGCYRWAVCIICDAHLYVNLATNERVITPPQDDDIDYDADIIVEAA